MNDINAFSRVAITAAREAGEYAREHLGRIKEIGHKTGANDLVTDVDKASEKMIIDRIKHSFPDHSILAEESGADQSGGPVRWIIDPLDGTVNYAHGFPVFCVSIGIEVDGIVVAGAVYDPMRNEMFTAEKDKGAFLDGEPINVSSVENVAEALVITGFAYSAEGKRANIDYFRAMIENAQAVRRIGSAALDLCYVACGRCDGFWELGLKPWDTAAGQLIVKEAGGSVTDLSGQGFMVDRDEILATNGRIHSEMLQFLK